jgi:serine/threonine protein kinase/Tfp pilus assembly protein PilF
MDPERWQRIKELLHSALERAPQGRAAFVDDACAGDSTLRSEVEDLIASHEQAGSFIESPAFELMANSLGDKTESLAGQSLGHYQVISLLGAGGMGEVYLAEDTRLGRKIALKILTAHFTQDSDRLRRFQQEARAASALNHPNILTIHEIGQIDSRHFMVTEFIEGETLRGRMAKAQMSTPEALHIASQIASALAAAHAAGIVHRDIKPENIMLREDGITKVLDFGLAKLTDRKTGEAEAMTLVKTEQGTVMGTARYMSPEQARGLPVDARTDIWSLGVVLYEMVGGRVPFEGLTSSDVIAAILDKKPINLARYAPEISPELEWIVEKTLRKDREERYQTTKELLTDLRNLKRRLEFVEDLDHSDSGQRSAELARRPGSGSYEASHVKAQSQGSQSHNVIDSLAILPLANTSADQSMDYFSDGISESIINSLSQLSELRVMAWSTVSRYRSMQVDPREAARELGVRAVLTGRIVQLGERLVIKIELVDARDGSHLWGESYSCQPSEILDIESVIASEISEKLLLRLTTEERRQLTKRYTDNVVAYDAYLRGRYCWNKRTDEGVRKAIEHFKQAIDNDPSYALAYSGLADSYLMLGSFGIATMSPREAFPKAREATLRALEIDDTLAEAHASFAYGLAYYDWNWPAAEKEFKRCFELKPGYATAHHWYGFTYLTAIGLLDQAIAEVRQALELDPLSLPISADVGLLLYLARRHVGAIDQFVKTLEMDQNFVYSHWGLALAYEQKQMYNEAIAEFQKAISLSGRSTLPLAQLGHAYTVSGLKSQALAVLDQLSELSNQRFVSPYRIAAIHAGLGDKDRAFQWLERAYEERDGWLIWLKLDPVMEVLSYDRRFTDLLRRIGLASHSERFEVSHSIKPSARGATSSPQTPGSAESNHEPTGGSYESGLETKAIAQPKPAAIAVLPFRPISTEGRDEILELGIADALITKLSDLGQIIVRPTSSVRKYVDLEQDSATAGRELAVESVLEGNIQKLGDRIRITVRLVKVEDGRSLWTGKFDEEFTDIFAVEDLISEKVTVALALKLTGDDKERLKRRYTEDTAAHSLYLKGRYYWNKRSEEALHKSIECFKQAIEIDRNYALAHAGLADCYTKLGDVGVTAMLPREAFTRARAAALKALEIDDSLAEVHASLGHIDMHQLRWADAERDFNRAIELNPNYATAHQWYAYYLAFHHRLDEALEKIEVALELDPLSLPIADGVGEFLYFGRRYDEAIIQFRKTLEMDPNFLASRINLGRAYEQSGMFSEAEDEFVKARQIAGESIDALAGLGHTYAMSGRKGAALEVLAQLTKLSKERYVSPYDIALMHTALAETDEAFRWLEKAYDECVEWVIYTNVDPRLDPLRSDARFLDLMRRIGFAPADNFHRGRVSSERQKRR